MARNRQPESNNEESAARSKAIREQAAREQHIPLDRLTSEQQEVRRAARALEEDERTQAQREEQEWQDSLPWDLLNPAQRELRRSAMARKNGEQLPIGRQVLAYAANALGGIGQKQSVTVYRTPRGLHINGDLITYRKDMPNDEWWHIRTTGINPDGSEQQTTWFFTNSIWLGIVGG